eukprot:256499-Heterocapsa_arctica.AAC.1
MADTTTNCGGKNCITCKGKMEGCQMLDTHFDIEQSTAIGNYVELKENPGFKDWTTQEKIDKFSSWLAAMIQTEKKALAAMGAIRMSQKQAKEYLKGQASLEYIHVTLVEMASAGQQACLGYVLYRQLDKIDYSK